MLVIGQRHKLDTNARKVAYDDYIAMSSAEQNDGSIRFCDDWPDDSGRTYYDEQNKMWLAIVLITWITF